jgi:DNA-binding CsgD family transcriptional regulator
MTLTSAIEALAVGGVPVSLPLDIHPEQPKVANGMALLALSHTPIEHSLYAAMHTETTAARQCSGTFSIRRLLGLSGLRSYGSVKRGCAGLVRKRSIETIGQDPAQRSFRYQVFGPEEIFARRLAAGLPPYPEEVRGYEGNHVFGQLIQHVVERGDLGRREALVVLCCAEGLSNAEIGARLQISEQTVKSHLRQIFDKFGVKRRTELVSQLLTLRDVRRKKNGRSRDRMPNEGSHLKNSVG